MLLHEILKGQLHSLQLPGPRLPNRVARFRQAEGSVWADWLRWVEAAGAVWDAARLPLRGEKGPETAGRFAQV